MQEYKNRIEAVLFTTGRFMDLDELSRLCGIASTGLLREAINELKQDYEKREGSLSLLEENGRFKLNIKKEYGHLTTRLLSECELDKPTQETLAVIAYKNPAMQSDIIKIRGTTAYDHIKFLRENDFIASEPKGRTRLLKLAPKFFEYFDVVEESLKAQLNNIATPAPAEQQETLVQQTDDSPAQEQSTQDNKAAEEATSDENLD